MYTVNHKKRDILFLTITLANLNYFYSFSQRAAMRALQALY